MVPSIDKALVIRFSSIGDILLSTPLVRAFRKRFPDCRLDFLIKSEYGDLIRHNPRVSGVIDFPSGGGFGELRELKRSIRASRYDLLIDIHDSLRSRFLCFGPDRTVRIDKRKIARFLLIRTGLNIYPANTPDVAARYLETVRPFGVEDDGEGLEVFIPRNVVKSVREMVSGHPGPLIGVAPGAMHSNKMWPQARFAEAAAALAEERHAGILLLGSTPDAERCAAIASEILARHPDIDVWNMAGRTTLLEAAGLLDHCSVVLTNDSGLMHLAVARKRKVVALFGPTVREFGFFPRGESTVLEHKDLPCRPCTQQGLDYCPKKHFRCLNDLPPGAVLDAARNILNQ